MRYFYISVFGVLILTFTGNVLSKKYASYSSAMFEASRIFNEFGNDENKYHMNLQSYRDLSGLFDRNGIFDKEVKQGVMLKQTAISKQCMADTLNITQGLKNKQEWAIRVIDAFGKVPPGVLDWNFLWLGNFDTCIHISKTPKQILGIKAPFEGKFCLADLHYSPDKTTQLPKITYGMCMPDSCNEEEIKFLANNFIQQKLGIQGNASISISEVSCNTHVKKYDTLAYAGISFLVVYAILLATATIYDVIKLRSEERSTYDLVSFNGPTENGASEKTLLIEKDLGKINTEKEGFAGKILRCFSMYSNGLKLLNTDQSMTELSSLNGIRFLSICWVLLGHTYFFFTPRASNILRCAKTYFGRMSAYVLFTSFFAVDSFFAMSGFLVTFFLIKELKKRKGKVNWLMFYFHRYWRLTPSYLILMFLIVSLSKYVSKGPLWPENGYEATECQKTWWYNMLYVNNFISDGKTVCLGWTWYLANDMQFYVISPLFILLLLRFEVIGIIFMGLTTLACMITSGILAYRYQLGSGVSSNVMFAEDGNFGTSYLKFYVRPYIRIGPYLVGVFTGYLLYKVNCTCKAKKIYIILGWIIAGFFGSIIVYGLYKKTGFYGDLSDLEAYMYQATSRVVWGCAVCWVIFACATGNGGFINTLLSWKPFVLLGRLSYCIYLVHPMVLRFYFDTKRSPQYYTDHVGIYVFLAMLTVSTVSAFVMSLTLEVPLISLEKVLLRKDSKKERT